MDEVILKAHTLMVEQPTGTTTQPTEDVAWLGTAKLVMGVPLTALLLWLSWILVRGTTAARPAPAPTPPAP